MVEASEQESALNHVANFTPIDRSTWDPIKERLPNSLFQKNRARVYSLFKQAVQVSEESRAVALFKGCSEVPLYGTDVSYPNYQEAYFYYVFGVSEMDCYGLVDFV